MSVDVVAIRRFPVKAMGGESLSSVAVDDRGLAGDRWFAVEDAGRAPRIVQDHSPLPTP